MLDQIFTYAIMMIERNANGVRQMARKVIYKSIQRTTKTQVGVTQVEIRSFTKEFDSVLSVAALGEIQRSHGMNFVAFTVNGEELGEYETRSQAGEALKKARDNEVKASSVGTGETTEDKADEAILAAAADTLSLEDAAKRICPDAKNPIAALRKRISRGSVATVVVDGETCVIL